MSPHMHQRSTHPHQGQRGAFIITTALLLLFLLGFMGIALDFGRMFVVRGELQTALDACALSAAAELDGSGSAINRAISSGKSAGNANAVNLQSADWSGQGQIVDGDISFRDAAYASTTAPTLARYAQCSHTQANIGLWLLQALNGFSGSALVPATGTVATSAVATRGSAQSTCPIPLALKPRPGGVAPDYGFVEGEWVTLLSKAGSTSGYIGWANLDGSNSAKGTKEEMSESCGSKVGDTLGTPGVQATVITIWNERFGIYKNKGDVSVDRPDYTGYPYTAANWPAKFNAYKGTPDPSAPVKGAQNYLTQRAAFAPCGTNKKACEDNLGDGLKGGYKEVAQSDELAANGYSRRIVLVPVINDASQLIDYACMLILQPLTDLKNDIPLEYLGNAGDPVKKSPCTTGGMPGGTAGPLVPVLVR